MDYFRQRFIDELNEEGDVEVRGLRWTRHQVLEGMDPEGAEVVFDAWVGQVKQECKERAAEFLEVNGCLQRFQVLCQRISYENVLPFVGAGMSIPSGFQAWGPFLTSLLADAPTTRAEVENLLQSHQYETAADAVENALGADVFAEEIETKLGSHHARVEGPVRLLPHIFKRECLTTNFDHVLARAYSDADLAFRESYCGTRLTEAVRRIGAEPHCLLRLHGDAHERNGRVLTAREYESAYQGGALKQLIERIVGARSFLFLGCGLATDRTFEALRQIKQQSPGEPTRHYAFLPQPPDADRNVRRQFLAEAEIHPIYYPADDHDQGIEDLLIALMEGGLDD